MWETVTEHSGTLKGRKCTERESKHGRDSLRVYTGSPSPVWTSGVLRPVGCARRHRQGSGFSSTVASAHARGGWVQPPVTVRYFFIRNVGTVRLHVLSVSLPALISSAFVVDDTDLNGALHTSTACLYSGSILYFFFFFSNVVRA